MINFHFETRNTNRAVIILSVKFFFFKIQI